MKVLTITAVIAAGIVAFSVLAYYYASSVDLINSYSSNESPAKPLNVQKEADDATVAFALKQQGLTLPEIYETVEKSVVQVTTMHKSGEPDQDSDSGLGSGFVFDTDGHVITNNHVITHGDLLAVTFSDGTIYSAKLVGSDPYTDLAVLSVEGAPKSKFVPIPIADSSKLRVGEQAVAIGSPFGFSGSMTSGIISGLGRMLSTELSSSTQGNAFSIPDVIQTDAPLNPGNSGGPLLNMKGEVIGINTALYSNTGEFSGIGLAVPSNTITKVVPSLVKNGSFKHPWLGVTGINMTPGIAKVLGLEEPKGFLVIDINPGSPALQSGLKGGSEQVNVDGRQIPIGGDVIIQIDGKPVRNIEDILVYLQREKSADDPIQLTVLRDGEVMEINTKLGTRPSLATRAS